jgi:acetyl esterase/lipase
MHLRIRYFVSLSVFLIISIIYVQTLGQEPTISDVYKLPSRPADQRLFYGSDSLQFGDLRLPDEPGPHPVAIIIHGGCWMSFASLKYTSPLADALRNEGIATWNVEYNRVGNPNGGWPGTFTDLAKGTDFLRQLSDDYPLDLSNVIVIGHSAGAHLALWVASRHKITPGSEIYSNDPLPVRGVVALASPTDMERSIGPVYEYCRDSVITKLIGGLPDEVPENYDNTSPISLLPIGVPQRLMVGELDIPLLLGQMSAYSDSALKLNEDIQLDTIEHVWHNELAIPGSISWLKVRATIKSLLKLSE